MSIDQGDGPKPGSSELASINKKGEHDPFIANFWNQFLEKASTIPSGFDVVTWPIRMIDELEFAIAASRASKLYPDSPLPKTNVVGEKLEPWKDGIKRIKT